MSNSIHNYVLSALIILQNYISDGYFNSILLLLTIYYFFINNQQIKVKSFKLLLPLFGILLLGSLGLGSHDVYIYFKDLYYVGKLILVFLFGFFISQRINNLRNFFHIYSITIGILCIIHILKFRSNFLIVFSGDVPSIKEIGGIGVYASFIIPPLFLLLSKHRISLSSRWSIYQKLIIFLLIISLLYSYSRTLILGALIALIIYFFRNKLNTLKPILISLFLLIMLISSSTIKLEKIDVPIEEKNSFYFKIWNSLSEVTMEDREDLAENLENWRGYEAYLGKKMFSQAPFSEKMIGLGFGSYVDATDVFGGTNKTTKINIFHNGYIYILLKTGFIGLFLYIYFLYSLLGYKLKYQHLTIKNEILTVLLFICVIYFFFTTFIVSGLINPSTLFPTTVLASILISKINSNNNDKLIEDNPQFEPAI